VVHIHPLDSAHAPMLLAGTPTCDSISVGYPKVKQVSDFDSGILPLLPENAPQSSDYPANCSFDTNFDFAECPS